ncbi:MAG TPA: hypothetical protein VMM17_06105 [Gemmatimonadaceae bacterium]|nr:hypothetical protein [Gemmatimonadaceae bacterium]
MSKRLLRGLLGALLLTALSFATSDSALAQAPSADSLARWIRGGYSLTVDSGQAPQILSQVRDVWGQLGWSGVGYGFRTFAARLPANLPTMDAFASAMDHYRITLNELHTEVVGDIGLAWGVHTEEFKPKGQPPESVRVRFTNTLKWDGTAWRSLLYHRDAQLFDQNGRYIRTTK